MSGIHPACRVTLAALALIAAGVAKADWLAADPGTPISLQINVDGVLVAAAANGSVVNLFAQADECDPHGRPLKPSVRIQGP
jgi:hypothetical protein